MQNKRSRRLWTLSAIVWCVVAIGVWLWTTSYGFTAGSEELPSLDRTWPTDSSLRLATDRPTLLLFVHPRCPCTRASIGELERTLSGAWLTKQQRPKCIVVATVPPDANRDWHDTDTMVRCAKLPQAEICWDDGGFEAARFGAVTSGAVMLFQQDGELLFAGGVTRSRGHEGGNVGSDQLLALLRDQSLQDRISTPVFGCKLCVAAEVTACDSTCAIGQPTDPTLKEEVVQ